MSSATIVHDPSEAVPLCPALGLYLKPIARVTISVSLPPPPPAPPPSPSSTSPPPRAPSRAVSNWEVMEGLRAMAQGARAPLSSLRLARGGPEVVRFEGEVENRALVRPALAGLDGKTMMLSGLPHGLRVSAAEATPPPTDDPAHPHDTIHLQGLPCRWFAPRGGSGGDEAGGISSPGGIASAERPSEALLRQAFGAFGEIRHVDIPMLDPYLGEDGSHGGGGGGRLRFEAYVQYRERDAYARAMAALRGAKLMFRGTDGKAVACGIKVTSDATQHLSEASIRRRQLERQKLQELEQRREEQKRKEREDEARRRAGQRKQREAEQQQRARRREEKLRRREARQRARKRRGRRREEEEEEEAEPQPVLGREEEEGAEPRRLLLAQRNLQSVRLIAALLARAEAARRRQREQSEERRRHAKEAELRRQQEAELRRQREAELRRVEEEKRRALGLQRRERELRHRLLALLLARGPGLGRLVGGAGTGSDVLGAGNSKMAVGSGHGEAGQSQTMTGSEIRGDGRENMKTGSDVATSGNGHIDRENEKIKTGSGIPATGGGTGDPRGADKQTGSSVQPTGSDAKTGNGARGTGGGPGRDPIAKTWSENMTTGSGSPETGSGVAKMATVSASNETESSSAKLKAMPSSCSDRERCGLEGRPSWHSRDFGGSSGQSRSREGSERRRPHEEEDGGGRDRKRGHRHREDRGRSRSRSPRRR
uniref:LOC288526 protein n=1 Tax=Rattus norvegicus TaxID=10116 RepID=B2RYB9_RAT|nr:LOC288526 protein [Rattus norvegicus]|eukprot:NP_001120718.1 A-kinase anchor protein 17A [Rattus norvegicus]